jgi:hypothetical protein
LCHGNDEDEVEEEFDPRCLTVTVGATSQDGTLPDAFSDERRLSING